MTGAAQAGEGGRVCQCGGRWEGGACGRCGSPFHSAGTVAGLEAASVELDLAIGRLERWQARHGGLDLAGEMGKAVARCRGLAARLNAVVFGGRVAVAAAHPTVREAWRQQRAEPDLGGRGLVELGQGAYARPLHGDQLTGRIVDVSA